MADVASWYRTLDLEPGASPEEVRQAWRDLAQVWHPDRFAGNERLREKAEQTLKQINEAYEGLRKLGTSPGAAAQSEPAAAPKRSNPYEPDVFTAAEPDQSPEEALADGVHRFNLWRKKFSDVVPKLPGTRLRGRPLEGIDFREVDLTAADLRGADLYKANLSEALLARAKLAGADLNRALMLSAVLSRADLTDADLSSADLRGADLREANLARAKLIGARLEGADLTDATGVEAEQVELATVDGLTKLPSLLRR